MYPQEIAQSEIGTINGGFYNLLTNKVHNVLSTPFYYPKTDNYSLLGDHETVHALFLNSFGISNSQLMVEGIEKVIKTNISFYNSQNVFLKLTKCFFKLTKCFFKEPSSLLSQGLKIV